MKDKEKDTELLILEAAKKVFILKGLDGARMQEIADEAGINKALLHYYFRSKEQLFLVIFKEEIRKFFPRVVPILKSTEMNYEEKIKNVVDNYINLFLNNPFLPVFIIREINRNPQDIRNFIVDSGLDIEPLKLAMIDFAAELGFSQKEAFHLIINIVSICVFPFAGKPIIEQILFSGNSEMYKEFLNERKRFVTEFIINSVKWKISQNK